MHRSIKIIGIGVISFFAFTAIGLIILLITGLLVIDPGITDNQLSTMNIEKHSTLPYTASSYLNISESQINQCMILKTTCQELIDSNQDSFQIELNNSEFNCILSFLESLSPTGPYISLIYYQSYFFKLSFRVS